jgi:hypothetical protein
LPMVGFCLILLLFAHLGLLRMRKLYEHFEHSVQ